MPQITLRVYPPDPNPNNVNPATWVIKRIHQLGLNSNFQDEKENTYIRTDYIDPDNKHGTLIARYITQDIGELYEITQKKIKKTIPEKLEEKTIAKLEKYNLKQTTTKDKKKLTEYYGGWIDNRWIELVRDNNRELYFLILDPEGLSLKSNIITDDKILVPPQLIPWQAPPIITNEDLQNFNPQQHLQNIITLLKKYVFFPEPALYEILALWSMSTWIREIFPVFPYLHFRGPKSCGKSKSLEALAPICYRGILTASPSEATMFREINDKGVTYFIDDLEQEDIEKRNLLGLLDSGYRRGYLYSRCAEKTRSVEYFKVAGFKAFSSRDTFRDVLESRCISVHMTRTRKKVPLFFSPKDTLSVLRGQITLRSVLMLTRMKQQQKTLEDGEDTYIEVSINNNNNNRLSVLSRTDELFTYIPLLLKNLSSVSSHTCFGKTYLSSEANKKTVKAPLDTGTDISPLSKPICPPLSSEAKKFIQRLIHQKQEEDQIGDESIVLEAIVKYISGFGLYDYPSSSAIARIINEEEDNPKSKWSSVRVGRILTRLNFSQKKIGGGSKSRGYVLEQDKLRTWFKEFDIDVPDKFWDSGWGDVKDK